MANATLYTREPKEVSIAAPPAPKPTYAPSVVEDIKLTATLTAMMSLEAFQNWSGQYKDFMKQNPKAFEEQGLQIAKAYLNKSIDSRLAMRLKTLLDEARNPKITETTTIKNSLGVLEQMSMDAKPLWYQGVEYFKVLQGPNESFKDWWARKMILKEQCELHINGISAKDLDFLELLRGVASHELSKEFLNRKKHKAADLVQTARDWAHGHDKDKNVQAAAKAPATKSNC